jgi:cytochrome P450
LFGNHLNAADDLTYKTLNDTLEFATVPQDKVGEEETQSRFTDHFAKLNDIAQGIIDRTRAAGHDHDSLDLPNLLIHSLDKETGQPLDDERIRNDLLVFMFAGHETTSLTMTWFHKLLEDRGDITEKIRAEVDAVLGDRLPRLEDLPKLTYTRQVINEVLRYRPTVPFVVRTARDDAELGGMQIKSGDVVAPYIWGAHRHPDFWNNPEAFDPDRFSAENSAGRDRRAYLPFGKGNRLCIGNEVALTELTVFAAQLAQSTTIEVEPNDVQPAAYVTIRPSGPIHATVRSRS